MLDYIGLESVDLGGTSVTVVNGAFKVSVPLLEGANSFALNAHDLAGNITSVQFQIERYTPPGITIDTPDGLTLTLSESYQVNGSLSEPDLQVEVGGVVAVVTGLTFAADVQLVEGRNIVSAVAIGDGDRLATDSVVIYRDSTGPRLATTAPVDGAESMFAAVDVSGIVLDLSAVPGQPEGVSVKVNGLAATVAGGRFLAEGVPLALGENPRD